jgi:hypothetical protein
MEKGSVRGALRPGLVIGAKYFGSLTLLRKEPNVIARRRVKSEHYSLVAYYVKVFAATLRKIRGPFPPV